PSHRRRECDGISRPQPTPPTALAFLPNCCHRASLAAEVASSHLTIVPGRPARRHLGPVPFCRKGEPILVGKRREWQTILRNKNRIFKEARPVNLGACAGGCAAGHRPVPPNPCPCSLPVTGRCSTGTNASHPACWSPAASVRAGWRPTRSP